MHQNFESYPSCLTINNMTPPSLKVVKGENLAKPGFLLDLSTVVGSVGVTVQEANIQGDEAFGPCCQIAEEHDFAKEGRIFRFLLSKGGRKLVRIPLELEMKQS